MQPEAAVWPRQYAEHAVILAACQEGLAAACWRRVQSAWFQQRVTQRAWRQLTTWQAAGEAWDFARLVAALGADGADLMTYVPWMGEYGITAEQAVAALATWAARDTLQVLWRQALARSQEDPEAALAWLAEASTQAVAQDGARVVQTAADLAKAHYHALQAREAAQAPTSWPYGLGPMDDHTLGVSPGQLVLIAGRPAQGKSALAMNLTRRWCQRGIGVAYASLEMPGLKCMSRWLAMETGYHALFLEKGTITDDATQQRYAAAVGRVGLWPLRLRDDPLDLPELIAWGRQEARAGTRIVVVDHAGLVDVPPRTREEVEAHRVGRLAKALKRVAMESGLGVVALVQLNRLPDREDREPQLSDLRDSGEWEASADVVWMVRKAGDDAMDVWLRKNRDGAADVQFRLTWERASQRLESRPYVAAGSR